MSDIDEPADNEANEVIDLERDELQRNLETHIEGSGEMSDHEDEGDGLCDCVRILYGTDIYQGTRRKYRRFIVHQTF